MLKVVAAFAALALLATAFANPRESASIVAVGAMISLTLALGFIALIQALRALAKRDDHPPTE